MNRFPIAIRVKKMPGDEPLQFRRRWVGTVLPAREVFGFRFGQTKPELIGYIVPADHAVQTLERRCPITGEWWRCHKPPHPKQYVTFRKEDVTVIRQ